MKEGDQIYTRQEVIELIEELIQYVPQVHDALYNEGTNWNGKTLLDLIETPPTHDKI